MRKKKEEDSDVATAPQPGTPEPAPKAVPLVKPKNQEGKPEEGPPNAPVSEGDRVPRLIHQNERAPAGLKRYVIRCDNYHPQPKRYVLARSEEEGRDYYMRAQRLDMLLEGLRRNGVEHIEQPALVVTELVD